LVQNTPYRWWGGAKEIKRKVSKKKNNQIRNEMENFIAKGLTNKKKKVTINKFLNLLKKIEFLRKF
jgi:hypothetical protein